MKKYKATVVWVDSRTGEAAVLIDGRSHTTIVRGTSGLTPGDQVMITVNNELTS